MAGRPRLVTDEEILDIALEEFARVGFDAVSLRELNRRLGMSPAMLAKRYGTKDALWEASVTHAIGRHLAELLDEAARVFEEVEDDLEQLRSLIEAFIRTASSHAQLQRIIYHEACRETPRVDHLFATMTPMLDALRPLVEQLVQRNRIRAVTERELFFLVANGASAVHTLAPLSARFDERDGPLDAQRYAETVADVLVRGLTSPTPGRAGG